MLGTAQKLVFAQQSCNNLPSEKTELRCKQLLCRIAHSDMEENDPIVCFSLFERTDLYIDFTSIQKT